MSLEFLVNGFVIGFAIAAPVGPIGILCIRRTLAEGRAVGFLSGLGAATADASYGAVAAFGLTVAQDFLVGQQSWLRIAGGLFLIYLGLRTFFARPVTSSRADLLPVSRLTAYLSTLALTLTNPATIISFAFVFSGVRLAETRGSVMAAVLVVAGVFLGSCAWWLTLSGLVGTLRERIPGDWIPWLNRLAGAVILVFGLGSIFAP